MARGYISRWKRESDASWRRRQEARALAMMDAEDPLKGLCYFAANAELVKIGYSKDPYRRVQEVELAADLEGVELLATINGHRFREAYYHQMFAEHRAFGEWFHRVPAIDAEIARLNDVNIVGSLPWDEKEFRESIAQADIDIANGW